MYTPMISHMNVPEHLEHKEKTLSKEAVQQEWVSYPSAEKFSGLSHTSLWRLVSSGELKAARVGRSVRIHLPTLRGFMEEKARGSQDK
jgi:excisionase family DNA binding protein